MRIVWLPLVWLALAAPALAEDQRVQELERKVDVLTREIEQMKLGGVADTARAVPRFGFGPAASKVYGVPSGVSIGGYGEALLQAFDRERQDGKRSNLRDRVDLLRSVVYLGYKFSDELLFNSEIEIEHSGVGDEAEVVVDTTTGLGVAELSGEVKMEFAYLDWSRWRSFGLRAGLLLVPLGLVNEMHEPPVFLGARRPEVEMRVIPSTWSAIGAGIFGEFANGIAYRAYLMEGLDASGFSARRPIRGGRQGGSQSLATHPALAARVDYSGAPGLTVGGAFYTGDSWQQAQPPGGGLDARVALYDLHARFEWRSLEARALYARGTLSDASRLSSVLGLALGTEFYGAYGEITCDVMPFVQPGSRYGAAPYVRYEEYDTQEGIQPQDPANHGSVLTAGATLKPHPSVVLKLDREQRRNDADTEVSQWNVALGYLF